MSDPQPSTLPANEQAEAWLDAQAEEGLAAARGQLEAITSSDSAEALDLLHLWNEMSLALSNVSALASVYSEMHPIEAVRTRGETVSQDVARLWTEISLDKGVFEAFDQAETARLDDTSARLHEKILRDFRRSGVDKDEATRDRIKQLNERMVLLGQEFGKNIRDDVRRIRVRPEQLAGLPQDWIDAHPADDDGLVTVTTDYPDVIPFSTFAHDANARRELRTVFLNRAWPQNDPLLHELFTLRQEYAEIVGYRNWADYDAEVKMIGSGDAIAEFVDKIAAAAEEPARRDYDILLTRMRQDHPDASVIDAADMAYYAELIRKENFDVDAQQVRTYFAFDKVRQGLLDVTGRLFGLAYRPVPDAEVWHPDVTAYDVHRGDTDERIGRIYLDLHPREGKYKHAAQFTVRNGIAGRQLPEGALACNFGRGLMEHDQVVTLFHEFGHLIHHVLGGEVDWVRFSGVATEWDFVEAPSQMLEEWAWEPGVLQTFATNSAGEPIPADLVRRMREADDFGKGYFARTQMFYAAMSYHFHVEQVEDLTERMKQLQAKYSLFPYIDGTHMTAAFGHLDGYSSGYYTYMWSLVIAKDMFSAFDREDMFNAEAATRYRDRVLIPGGTKDAADLVEDFLGRPYSFDAFADWLTS